MELRSFAETRDNLDSYLEKKPRWRHPLSEEQSRFLNSMCDQLNPDWKDKTSHKRQPWALQEVLEISVDGDFWIKGWEALQIVLDKKDNQKKTDEIIEKAPSRIKLHPLEISDINLEDFRCNSQKYQITRETRENFPILFRSGAELQKSSPPKVKRSVSPQYEYSDDFSQTKDIQEYLKEELNGLKEEDILKKVASILKEISQKTYNKTTEGDFMKTASDKKTSDILSDWQKAVISGEKEESGVCGGIHKVGLDLLTDQGIDAGLGTVTGHTFTVGRLENGKLFIIDYNKTYTGNNLKDLFRAYEKKNGTFAILHYITDKDGNIIGSLETPIGEFLKEKFYAEQTFSDFVFNEKAPERGVKILAKSKNGEFVGGVKAREIFKNNFSIHGEIGKDNVDQENIIYMTAGLDWLKKTDPLEIQAGIKGGAFEVGDSGDPVYNLSAYVRGKKTINISDSTQVQTAMNLEGGGSRGNGYFNVDATLEVKKEITPETTVYGGGRVNASPGGNLVAADSLPTMSDAITPMTLDKSLYAGFEHSFRDGRTVEFRAEYKENEMRELVKLMIDYEKTLDVKNIKKLKNDRLELQREHKASPNLNTKTKIEDLNHLIKKLEKRKLKINVTGESIQGSHWAVPESREIRIGGEFPTGISIYGSEVTFGPKASYRREEGFDEDEYNIGGFLS
ncbi:MAG: hypothetical protein OEL89_04850, partial [Candidatus Peregrinibacteria bacterium]|nr:hypothetical protein [Candidatus Peregrinibacteria bacterium]